MSWIITWHWTAGAYGVNTIEADAYHFIISADGKVTPGVDRPEDNIPPLRPGAYAASTLNLNSYNISIAVDAMGGASERPFDAGKWPITEAQVEALVALSAKLSLKYNVPVTRTRMLSHAEVQGNLKVAQRNKWDIAWLPGMKTTGSPLLIGDQLRKRVNDHINVMLKNEEEAKVKVVPKPVPKQVSKTVHKPVAKPTPRPNFLQRLIKSLFG